MKDFAPQERFLSIWSRPFSGGKQSNMAVLASQAEQYGSIGFPENVSITHCRLNRRSHNIYWKSLISILGTSCCEVYIFLEKNG